MWFFWQITLATLMVSQTTQAANIVCYSGSITNSKELSLSSIGELLNTVFLPSGCELVVTIPGLENVISNGILDVISNLISQFGTKKCYCSLNWQAGLSSDILDNLSNPVEAVEGLLDPLLGSTINPISVITALVNDFFTALKVLENGGLDLGNLHLIGFSEGALLAGLAGQVLKDANFLIGRISGFNPVSIPLIGGLEKGAAKLVDCIHTSDGLLSLDSSNCDIDFWVNHGCDVQPGCVPSILPISSDLCSINRAVQLLAESVSNPSSLQGRKASSYYAWTQLTGTPSSSEINFIGFDIKPSLHGSFYLCTSSSPPFGKGIQGCIASSCSCL